MTCARRRPPGRIAGLGLLDRPARSRRNRCSSTSRREVAGWPSAVRAAGAPPCSARCSPRPCRGSPGQVHVHVVDHGGGGWRRRRRPAARGTVTSDDALRTVRLIDRLTQEVTARRARGGRPAPRAAPARRRRRVADGPARRRRPATRAAAFLRLVRDGAAVGLTCVLTADRAVPGARLAGAVAPRLVLPLADRADYAVAGIPAARRARAPAARPGAAR